MPPYTQGPVGGSQLAVSRAHLRAEDSGLYKHVEDCQRAGQEGDYCEGRRGKGVGLRAPSWPYWSLCPRCRGFWRVLARCLCSLVACVQLLLWSFTTSVRGKRAESGVFEGVWGGGRSQGGVSETPITRTMLPIPASDAVQPWPFKPLYVKNRQASQRKAWKDTCRCRGEQRCSEDPLSWGK